MPSTAGKALEVFTLVANVSGGVVHCSRWRVLRLERIHVATNGHRGAALWNLLCLLSLQRGLNTVGDAVLGQRLEGSLGSELRVIV